MFLAGPFKALVNPETGMMSERNIHLFNGIIEHFERRGWDVHCAHKREGWGREFMSPALCTRIDFDEISKCDYFVAFPGSPASPGTHIELGWASALGKRVILLQEVGKEYAFLVRGLGEIATTRRVEYSGEDLDPALIEAEIVRFEC
jgi:hypothetical protein